MPHIDADTRRACRAIFKSYSLSPRPMPIFRLFISNATHHLIAAAEECEGHQVERADAAARALL